MNKKKTKSESAKDWQLRSELRSGAQETPEDLLSRLDRKAWAKEVDLHTMVLREDTTLAASAGGSAALVITSTPSTSSNWSSYAGCFDEYRVLAMTVEVVPVALNGGSTQAVRTPIAGVVDLDNNAPLTGYTVADYYSSSKQVDGGKRFRLTGFMSGSENSTFVSTASAGPLWYIKLYTAGNTASLPLGQLRVTRYVQFRGQGL